MIDKDMIYASALASLPEIGSEGALPESIQVFPPGNAVKFTLQDYPGHEFEMDVDAATAAKANADLQNLILRANAGQGPKPFADKNHEDAEATFAPVEYFWGGNDKQTGGVRLKVNWNPFGAQLVRAKAFRYFSQNFLFSKTKKKFLGLINENVGGLVNRPGFSTQAAFARADKSLLSATSNQIENMTANDAKQIGQIVAQAVAEALNPTAARAAASETPATGTIVRWKKLANEFWDLVNQSVTERGITQDQAIDEVCAERPDLGAPYRRRQQGISPTGDELDVVPASAKASLANGQKPFMDLVETIQARAAGTSLQDAVRIAEHQRPDLYAAYHNATVYGSRIKPVAPVVTARAAAVQQAKAGAQEFTDIVQAYAQAQSVPLDQAVTACTRMHPQLAEDYLSSMRIVRR